ncbi:hypothetical protein [Streptococcus penaeicida]|uniref:hypothetical protein n=1 Tax=Streptococcus penaeicida TaxID=1765960 RepID=UPI0039F0A394
MLELELGLEAVLVGLAIFSLGKIFLFIKLSDKFLPKVAKKASKKTYYLKKGDQKISPAQKFKRDYFR